MANPYTHVVKKGEHLFLLSDEYNVKPGVILEANPALKERENTLLPGEELVIPVNEEKDELGATEEHHPFGSDRSKVLLRLRILKGDFSPAVGAPYTLHIDGEEAARTGNTNGDGMIEENNIPMQTTDATLTVRILPPEPTDGNEPGEEISGAIPVVYSLKVGALEPIRTPCSE